MGNRTCFQSLGIGRTATATVVQSTTATATVQSSVATESATLDVQPSSSVLVICLGQSLLQRCTCTHGNAVCFLTASTGVRVCVCQVPNALRLRVDHAVALCKHHGCRIYVSGGDVAKACGNKKCDHRCGVTEADVMLRLLQDAGIDRFWIEVDKNARNTIENAINAVPIIKARAVTETVLVTSGFHIPRSAFVFVSVFKHEGLDATMMKASGAPSGLESGPLRTQDRRPDEINDWRYAERIDHETGLMDARMKGWIESYQIRISEDDFQTAKRELQQLAA